jgi:chemotaxis protein MotA
MDLATIIGVVISTLLVVTAILMGGEPIIFFDPSSALIVIGGTVGATLMRNSLSTVLGTLAVVRNAFATKVPAPEELIAKLLETAKTARKDILALEKLQFDYPFLGKGIRLCVDGSNGEQIRQMLETDIRGTVTRHKRGQEVLIGAGQAAPAFGMIGTLIGLVQMLANMSDPSSIGPAMALALLTTLYGAFLANVLCLPLADKLKVRSQDEVLSMTLCLEATVGIADKQNPRVIEQALQSFVAPKLRGA